MIMRINSRTEFPLLGQCNKMPDVDLLWADEGTGHGRVATVNALGTVQHITAFLFLRFSGIHQADDTGQHGVGAQEV